MKKVFFLLFIVVMVACKDDDKPAASVSAILTSKANGWVFTSIMVGSVDAFQSYDDCDKDDATVFASTGTFTVRNSVKCDPDEADPLDSGTWSVSSDQKTLSLTLSDGTESLTILEIDDSHIKGTLTLDIGGTSVTATVTLVPKS